MTYVGKKVHIYFKDGEKDIYGTLGYIGELSAKQDYRERAYPEYFSINHTAFKARHVRKLTESEVNDKGK
jgi:hypothetical protein